MQRESLAVVLDPGWRAGVREGVCDGDDPAGEETLVEFPVGAADGEGGVATDAPTGTDRERLADPVLGEVIGMALGIALGLGAGAATGCAPRAGTVKHNLPPTGGEVRFA
ncbi:MAG: hypothetical protein ACOY3Y_11505, partial [Acidobacteriota bacterium]